MHVECCKGLIPVNNHRQIQNEMMCLSSDKATEQLWKVQHQEITVMWKVSVDFNGLYVRLTLTQSRLIKKPQ